jgi:hypothetical protein
MQRFLHHEYMLSVLFSPATCRLEETGCDGPTIVLFIYVNARPRKIRIAVSETSFLPDSSVYRLRFLD